MHRGFRLALCNQTDNRWVMAWNLVGQEHTVTIAMTYLSIPTFATLIRSLQDNPSLREVCGITDYSGIPSITSMR